MRILNELPELTHLQFLVLSILGSSEVKGRELRDQLKQRGVDKSGPAFYQMMSRLEESGMVKGWYSQEIIDGQIIKERNYKLLGKGRTAWNDAREFYERIVSAAAPKFAYA